MYTNALAKKTQKTRLRGRCRFEYAQLQHVYKYGGQLSRTWGTGVQSGVRVWERGGVLLAVRRYK